MLVMQLEPLFSSSYLVIEASIPIFSIMEIVIVYLFYNLAENLPIGLFK